MPFIFLGAIIIFYCYLAGYILNLFIYLTSSYREVRASMHVNHTNQISFKRISGAELVLLLIGQCNCRLVLGEPHILGGLTFLWKVIAFFWKFADFGEGEFPSRRYLELTLTIG